MVKKPEHWRVEIFRTDDVLDWKLVYVVDDVEDVTDYGHSYVVADMFHDAGKALEGYLPEVFS